MDSGRRIIGLALDGLRETEPGLSSKFAEKRAYVGAQTRGSVHWAIAVQSGKVTNPMDNTGTPRFRVAAELAIQRRDSPVIFRPLFAVLNAEGLLWRAARGFAD